MKKAFILSFVIFFIVESVFAWGFWAHKRINRMAVYTLPQEMLVFYKPNIEYLTEHAVDPDKRRYAVEGEACKHYIDIDHYGEYPFEDFPKGWSNAIEKYSEDTVRAYGILPWNILWTMKKLTIAFQAQDGAKILKYSADLGHYVGDAHVPLHTTENYNGHLTDQHGIHGFWESRLPELFNEDYDYWVGKAEHIEKPFNFVWSIVLKSHSKVDSVLLLEKELDSHFDSDNKYGFEERYEQTVKVYSQDYSSAYHASLNNMVEQRMKQSIKHTGDLWFTCWVLAGKPDLSELSAKPLDNEKLKDVEAEKYHPDKKIKGRKHANTGIESLE